MAVCECGCGARLPDTLYKGRVRRFIRGHNGHFDPDVHFWPKVDKTGKCWQWTGIIQSNGYGVASSGGGRQTMAHRLAYELSVGPIPEGLHIDHLCRVRACVRPSHLEAVTQAENNRRAGEHQKASGTRCRRDHEYTPENTYYNSKGNRGCQTCMKLMGARWRARQG